MYMTDCETERALATESRSEIDANSSLYRERRSRQDQRQRGLRTACAELGYRTVVLSTDSAHSLGDSFDTRIGSELVELAPNLWGQEIDLLHQMDKYWGRVQDYLNVLFSWRGMDSLVAEETSVLPGMVELASLMHITASGRQRQAYDTIIIDAAPTGSTLQLLSFPDIASLVYRENHALRTPNPADRPTPSCPV